MNEVMETKQESMWSEGAQYNVGGLEHHKCLAPWPHQEIKENKIGPILGNLFWKSEIMSSYNSSKASNIHKSDNTCWRVENTWDLIYSLIYILYRVII